MRNIKIHIPIFIFLNLIFSFNLFSQNNLQQKITVNIKNQSLKEVLKSISEQADINFSYSNQQIDESKMITLVARNQSIESVLNILTNNLNLKYTIVEKQIVLHLKQKTQKPKEIEPITKPPEFTISGYVKDEENGEIFIGALIIFKSKNFATATSTNVYGFYSMTLPTGDYEVSYSFLGYEKSSTSIKLVRDFQQSISLKRNIQELKIVFIDEYNKSDLTRGNPLESKIINSYDLKRMPVLGGEYDVIKSLQSVSGINLYGEGSVIFNVRGGDKGQNAVFIDEAPVYNPSHLLGFFSAIAPDAINSISIYKNDFPIQYGDRLSCLVDIRTKNGNMKKLGFDGNISPLLSTFTIDGPIKKDKSSFLLTFRKSHINYLFKKIAPNMNINFYDFHAKYNLKFKRKNRIFFAFYTGSDDIQIKNSALRWNNSTFTFKWNHLFSNKLFSNATLYASSYIYTLYYSIPDEIYWTSNIKNVSLKNDFTYYKNSKNKLFFGYETKFHSFNPGNLNYEEYYINTVFASNVLENIAYFGGEYRTKEKFLLKYGIRLLNWNNFGPTNVFNFDENYQVIDTTSYGLEFFNSHNRIEPRISGLWAFSNKFSASLSFSHNVQFLHYLSNSISPFTTLDVWMPSSINIKPQTADQFSASFFLKLPEIEFSTELYYKKMKNQIDFSNQPNLFINPLVESQLRFGKSTAYGAEFSLKKQKGSFQFVINYAYSRVIRQTNSINNSLKYPAIWDKPHYFYSNFSYDLSPRISLNTTFVYSSGNKFSSPTGFYYFQNYTLPIYEQKNNDKLPDYHRLDLALKWRINKKNDNRFSHYLTLSIYNLYGHKNVIGVNFNKIETVGGDFVIPSNFITENEIVPTSMSILGIVPSISYMFMFR